MPGTAAGAAKARKQKATRLAVKAATAEQAKGMRRLMLRARKAAELQSERGGHFSGLDINLQKIDEEYVPALRDLNGRIGIFQQMGNDAKIAAQLRANILPLFSAVRATVEGGTTEQRDLIRQNLLREGDPRFWCDTSWMQRLLEKLMCLHYGFALHYDSWAPVDGYQIIRSKTYLHPKSLGGPLGPWEWDMASGRLAAVHRKYKLPDGTQVTDERILIEDLDATVWWQTGENWEGVSLIRPMYRNFVNKDLASKIAMIALMNGGVGIPMGTLGPTDGSAQATTLKTQAKDLRGGSKERQFLILGNGQKMEFLTTNGAIVDASPVIDAQNMDIASGGATGYMETGNTASGSRAGGSVMFVASLQQLDAVARWLQEQINHGAGYLDGNVEKLIYSNFKNVKECPQITLSRVSPTEQLDNVPNICTAVQQGAITHDLTVENHCRRALGVKELTQAQLDAAKAASIVTPLGGRPDSPTPTDRNEPRDDQAGRAFGLAAEKKSPDAGGASRPMKRPASYPWLRSRPA